MPAPLLALLLAVTQPEMAIDASPESPSHIADSGKGNVETTLERIGNDPARYRVRFNNRNPFPVRVDYRMESSAGAVGNVASVVLRNYGSAASYERTAENASNNWDKVELVLPTGIDYTDIRIYDVVQGNVRERMGTRVSSNGVSENYTEVEFTPTPINDPTRPSVETCPRPAVPVIIRTQAAVPATNQQTRPPTAEEIRARSMGLPKHDGSDGTSTTK
jgi:hypothetical protein